MLLLRELYDALLKMLLFSVLGTRQFFSFATTTMWQRTRKRAAGTRKNWKNIKVSVSKWSCQNEYSKNAKSINFEAWYMVTLSRQGCRVPSSDYFSYFSNHSNQSLTAWYTWNHRIAWQRREFCPAEAPASCSSCLKWLGCKLCFKHFYVTHRVLINI